MKILVTGGAGFIGYHVVKRLYNRGYEITVLDNLSRSTFEKEIREMGIKLIEADIRDLDQIEEYFRNIDAVIHLAALVDVRESMSKPLLYNDVNVKGTLNVLLASKKNNVKKLIFASSAAVYGEPKYLPIDEKHTLRPLSIYGSTKVASEGYCFSFNNSGLRTVILRLFNVYGEGQSKAYAGVITTFIRRLLQGLPPIIFGDGNNTRDFIYVSDVANAFLLALEREFDDSVFNIGTGIATSVNDIAYKLIDLCKVNLEPIYSEPRPGDIKHSVADISKARKILGFKVNTSLDEGLIKVVKWYEQRLSR